MTTNTMILLLREHFKDDQTTLTTRISEIVFDITTCMDVPYLCGKLDIDSRTVFQEILEHAWEFEFFWVTGNKEEDHDYLTEVDEFAYKLRDKLIDTYGKN